MLRLAPDEMPFPLFLRTADAIRSRRRSALSDYCISIRGQNAEERKQCIPEQPGYRALCSGYRGDSLNKTATSSPLLFRSSPIPLSRYFSSLQREAQSSWIWHLPAAVVRHERMALANARRLQCDAFSRRQTVTSRTIQVRI